MTLEGASLGCDTERGACGIDVRLVGVLVRDEPRETGVSRIGLATPLAAASRSFLFGVNLNLELGAGATIVSA